MMDVDEEKEGPCEMHCEDDKPFLPKNTKRIAKTRAQTEALEKFYNEHKYPTEIMKSQFAKSTELTEKQVSGWFCHRRLKDKRLMNGELKHAIVRQDRSSGVVIQDRGSGHRQDSCGSTKLGGDDKNLDTREVESGRLVTTLQDCELRYDRGAPHSRNHNRPNDASSGSSSPLRNTPYPDNRKGAHFDLPSSRCVVPKVPMGVKDVRTRSGPTGYLKLKGNVENAAITAVKMQLGRHYRLDGPALGIEFDQLPPGAFESSMQDPADEIYYTEEALLPASPDISKIQQHPKFGMASDYRVCEYNSGMASRTSKKDQTSIKTTQGSDIHQKFRKNTSSSDNGAYYPWRNSVDVAEGSARDISVGESRDDYGTRHLQGSEVMRIDSISSHRHLQQPYGGKVREGRDNRFHTYDDVTAKISRRENIENESFSLSTKGYAHHNSLDKVLHRESTKEERAYAERRIAAENRVRFPLKNDTAAQKRTRDGFLQHQHLTVMDNQPGMYQVRRFAQIPSSFREHEQSAETSSSMD